MNDKLQAFFKSFSDADDSMEFRMADTFESKPDVISTGSPSLDDALCSSGIPLGRIIQLYGLPGSGKSAMSFLLIKEAQKKDPEAFQVFIDSEGTFSASFASKLGADPSKIMLIQGDLAVSAKKLFDMLTGIPKEDSKHFFAGKSKKGLLDEITEKNINVNLIVLDSLGSLLVPQEQIAEAGAVRISPVPRFLSTALKKLSLEVKKANVAMIIINHVRSTMDMYGPDHTSAGGNSYHHFLSANIFFEMISRKDAQVLNDKEEKVGHKIRATIEKNKLGVWPRKCEFKVDFTKGIIDTHEEIGELAIQYGIVERPTSMSYVYKDNKWVGAGKFSDALSNNPELLSELSSKIEEMRNEKYFGRKTISNNASPKLVDKPKKADKSLDRTGAV